MSKDAIEIAGEFEREIWCTPEHESPRFMIATVNVNANSDGKVTEAVVKGYAEEGELRPGIPYRFYGNWKTHKRHGKQFEFKTFTQSQPHGRRGVIRYLMQLPGIGEVIATRMWDTWESNAINTLRERPAFVADKIAFLTPTNAEAASGKLKQAKMLEDTTIALLDLLDGRGYPKKSIREAIQRWGNRAPEMIRVNPYLTVAMRGVGFAIADKLYLDLGKNPARIKRQTMCLEHAILNDGSGHTWFDALKWCQSTLREKIASANVDVGRAVKLGVRTKRLAFRRDDSDKPWVAYRRHAESEKAIADKIKWVIDEPALWDDMEVNASVTKHQAEHLRRATQGKIGILTGSPGTGKTFSTGALVQSVIAKYGDGAVAVCAPTGKAAVRVTEAMNKFGVHVQARTIHSTLRARPLETGPGWEFEHNSNNPLPQQFIFVDESSMCETELVASLLRATHRDTHLLFTGDVSQLPPVGGHGAPLRDFIAAGLPHGELIEIQRNSGRIVKACAQIKATGHFDTSTKLDVRANENLIMVPASDPETQKQRLLSLIQAVDQEHDPVWDLQVLCAINDKSPVSRKHLNPWLQSFLNKDGEGCDGSPFRVGDKIMCTKNSWCNLTSAEGTGHSSSDDKVFVANGELGRVHEVSPGYIVVDVESPYRRLFIPRAVNGKSETGCDWVLAYACTCHKYQGSEVPIVAVMLDDTIGAKLVCDRAWVYTAISRAKYVCVLIGEKTTVEGFCQRQTIHKRKTFLMEAIHRDT
jgi:exodeoxyribonuclease V alpha subunit